MLHLTRSAAMLRALGLAGPIVVTIGLAGCIASTPGPTVSPTVPPSPTASRVASPLATPGTAESLLPTSTATGGPTPTLAPATTVATSAVPSPTAPATPGPAPTATATPAASADPQAWIGPLRVSDRHYSQVSLVATADGQVHAAARLGSSVWHVTNATGEWLRTEISSPPSDRADIAPSIAMDAAGSLAVAFERIGPPDTFGRFPEGIFLVTGGPSAWSAALQLDPLVVREPSLAVGADGTLFVVAGESFPFDVVEEGQTFPIHLLSGLPGNATRERIARIGTDPVIATGSDGLPRILLGDSIGTLNVTALRYMTPSADGGFVSEEIPGTSNHDLAYDLVIDPSGVAHAIWHSDEETGLWYSNRDAAGWTTPVLVQAGLVSTEAGLGVDAAGAVHIVTASYSSGAWYFSNRGGTFTGQQLHTDLAISADLAVDGSSRAHMLFVLGRPFDHAPRELWYAAAPGS